MGCRAPTGSDAQQRARDPRSIPGPARPEPTPEPAPASVHARPAPKPAPESVHVVGFAFFGLTLMIHSPLLKSFTYASPSFGFTTTPQVNAAFFVLPSMSAVLRCRSRGPAREGRPAARLNVEHVEAAVVRAEVQRVARDPHVVHAAYLRRVPRDRLRMLDVAHVHHLQRAVHAARRRVLRALDGAVAVHLVGDEDVVLVAPRRVRAAREARAPTRLDFAVQLVEIVLVLRDELRV